MTGTHWGSSAKAETGSAADATAIATLTTDVLRRCVIPKIQHDGVHFGTHNDGLDPAKLLRAADDAMWTGRELDDHGRGPDRLSIDDHLAVRDRADRHCHELACVDARWLRTLGFRQGLQWRCCIR